MDQTRVSCQTQARFLSDKMSDNWFSWKNEKLCMSRSCACLLDEEHNKKAAKPGVKNLVDASLHVIAAALAAAAIRECRG